jgi:hypothetical protein
MRPRSTLRSVLLSSSISPPLLTGAYLGWRIHPRLGDNTLDRGGQGLAGRGVGISPGARRGEEEPRLGLESSVTTDHASLVCLPCVFLTHSHIIAPCYTLARCLVPHSSLYIYPDLSLLTLPLSSPFMRSIMLVMRFYRLSRDLSISTVSHCYRVMF